MTSLSTGSPQAKSFLPCSKSTTNFNKENSSANQFLGLHYWTQCVLFKYGSLNTRLTTFPTALFGRSSINSTDDGFL